MQADVGLMLQVVDANHTALLWKTIRDDEDLRTGKKAKAMKKEETEIVKKVVRLT